MTPKSGASRSDNDTRRGYNDARRRFGFPREGLWPLSIAALALLFLSACGDPTGSADAQPEALELQPASAIVDEGELLELRAFDPGHADVDLNGSLEWESSDPSIATVQGGTVQAVRTGEVTVTASTSTGVTAQGTIEVVRIPDGAEVMAETAYEATVGEVIDEVAVRLLSRRGLPVTGVSVHFDVTSGAGTASPAVTQTDEEGIARSEWTLGPLAGEQEIEVRLEADSEVLAVVSATAAAGPPYELSIFPEEASVRPGVPFMLEAQIRDAFGNRLTSIPADWASGDEEVAQVGADGRVVGITVGSTTVEAFPFPDDPAYGELLASSPNLHHRDGHSGGHSRVEVVDGDEEGGGTVSATGDGQSGVVGETLAQPIAVEVTDAEGRPLRQVLVEWTVQDGGGTVSETSTRTNGQGRAEVEWTLGTTVETNRVHARVGDLGTALFSATALTGPIAEVHVSPPESSIEAGSTVQFAAAATDQYGNPVTNQGAPTWTVGATTVAVITADGLATGIAAGSTTVEASIGGVVGGAGLTVSGSTGDGGSGGSDSGDDSLADPEAVTTLAVQSTDETSATLHFTQVDDGTGAGANYQVRYALTPLGWGWGTASPVTEGTCEGEVMGTAPGEPLTCTVEGLSPGTSYDFQLISYRGLIADGSRVYGGISNVATGVTDGAADGGSGGGSDGDDSGGDDPPPPTGGSIGYPNENGSNTLIAWSPMSEMYTWGPSDIASGTGSWWQWEERDPNTSLGTADGIPGGPYFNRTRFPQGQSPGSAPVAWGAWSNGSMQTGTEQQRLYFSQHLRLVDSGDGNWESQAVGTKLGFWGVGRCSGAANELYTLLEGGTRSGFTIRFMQQNTQSRSMNQNRKSGEVVQVGVWHHWEMEMILNDIGSANGVFRWWIDGDLVFEYTDVVYRTSGDSCGFRGYKWDPTWGGTGTTNKSRDDFLDISDIRISGTPLK